MKRARLGDVVRYKGALCTVVGIGEGTSVILREMGKPDSCPTCGYPPIHDLLEASRLFQDGVEPVQTLGSDLAAAGD